MPQKIKGYEKKKNHDLLVELIVQGNSTIDLNAEQHKAVIARLDHVNGTLVDHERRLDRLDGRAVPAWMQSKWKVGGLSTALIGLMTVLCRLAEKLMV